MGVADEAKSKMNSALEHFKGELKNLRTNRANASILDSVQVEVYGATMRLKELANVTTPEARQILVSPFDPQTVGPIAKGIERANLNLQPISEGNIIRINVPPMDESMRKQIVKQGKQMAEDAKIVIRKIRRDGNELVGKQKTAGVLTEDMVKGEEKKIQEHTDKFCKEIDTLFTTKEKEILTV
jgi:ribosome recycling factor